MQGKHIMKRTVALALAITLLLSLCACDAQSAGNAAINAMEAVGISMAVVPGERLIDSPWINSDLENSIDENTELNLKDDFHAAVNRDWLLEHTAVGDECLTSWDVIDATMTKNKYALLYRDKDLNPDPNVMSKETLTHIQDLLWDMIDLASDQEKRNELALEPLVPYLKAIENIDSLEEMTQYLINADMSNLTGEDFIHAFIEAPVKTRDFYTVYIAFTEHLMLANPQAYGNITLDSYNLYNLEKEIIAYVLGEMGYTPREIKKVITNCYSFERAFSGFLPTSVEREEENYRERGAKSYTLEDLRKIQGKFPLTQLLEAAGVAHSETFRIFEPGYVHFLGTYYKQKNLDKLKAYFLVHTILDSMPYLDETCQAWGAEMKEIRNSASASKDLPPVEPEDPTDSEAMEQYRLDSLMYGYIKPLLKVPFELAYIGNYFSSETKQEIKDIVEQVRAFYVDLLANVEWLSQPTRDLAVEKAQKMAVRVMYPDVLPDYSNLTYKTYEEGGNLLDAVAAINQDNHVLNTEKINQPVNRADWNLGSMSTLVVNAYNENTSNGIVILGGILAGGFMYDPDAPIEQNYARLGAIIGHEVSHSFDTNGYGFDSEGLAYGWFTNDDEVALRQRSDKLASYYSKLMYLPRNNMPYTGTTVQGEAISDMGGVKCMLALAEEIPDFDYDLFFRSYAATWARQTSYNTESTQAREDSHPLGFFRTNVTLQQFDKFFETYGIGPGDGMYLAPEDRILVW